jgi:hypothetical protein
MRHLRNSICDIQETKFWQPELGVIFPSLFSSSFPNDLLQTTINTYRDIYLKKQREGKIKLFPDVRNCLISLSQGNKRMAVVTTKRRTAAEELLQGLQIDHFFEGVVGSEDVQNCKPNPEPILLAMRKLKRFFLLILYTWETLCTMHKQQKQQMFFLWVCSREAEKKTNSKNTDLFFLVFHRPHGCFCNRQKRGMMIIELFLSDKFSDFIHDRGDKPDWLPQNHIYRFHDFGNRFCELLGDSKER